MSGWGSGAEVAQSNCGKCVGLRPHAFFTFTLRDLGPQIPSGHMFCAISIICFFIYVLAYLGEWTTTILTQHDKRWRCWQLTISFLVSPNRAGLSLFLTTLVTAGATATRCKNRHIGFNGCLGRFLGRNLVTNSFLSGYLGPFRPFSGRKAPR